MEDLYQKLDSIAGNYDLHSPEFGLISTVKRHLSNGGIDRAEEIVDSYMDRGRFDQNLAGSLRGIIEGANAIRGEGDVANNGYDGGVVLG